jgi:hypothetical protein
MRAALRRCSGLAAHQLVEIALLPACGFILHKKSEPVVFEFIEPFVPRNLFEGIAAAVSREIQTNDARIVAAFCRAHGSRSCVAFLRPATDLITISQSSCFACHPLNLA